MDREIAMINAEKRRTRAILVVLIPITVVMIILAIVAGVFANKAGNKNPASAEEFLNAAIGEKYQVYDVKSEIGENDRILSALVAKKDDSNSVTFIDFKNKSDAKSFFASTARNYKSVATQSGDNKSEEKNLENYSYYISAADGNYMHVVRVRKTVLFANVAENNMENVKRLVRRLNY